MHTSVSFPAIKSFRWLSIIRSEIILHWRFNRYDISATVIPGLLFLLAAWHSDQLNWSTLPNLIFWGAIYFWLYCICFCISNQLAGEAEDRLNKPDRPLVQGLVSRQGAFIRWVIAMGLFSLLGWWLGVLEWTLLWQVTLTLHNFGHFARHYWLKPFDGVWRHCSTSCGLANGTAIDTRSVDMVTGACDYVVVKRIVARPT